MAIRQQTTHSATRGYDSRIVCYVRDESGPLDLAGKTLTASVRSYGSDGGWCDGYGGSDAQKLLASVPATQDAAGEVSFVLTADLMAHQMCGSNLYRFAIDADGELVYPALLEVHGG